MLKIAGAVAIGWIVGLHLAPLIPPGSTGINEQGVPFNESFPALPLQIATGVIAYWILGKV